MTARNGPNTRAAFRAILRGNPDKYDEKPVQLFAPTLVAAQGWAQSIMLADARPQATVEIYRQVEELVETVRK